MIGEKIIRFKTIESTNEFIKVNYKSLDNKTIVISDIQTKGRGRRNHTWKSEIGNLYFSFLIKENINRLNVFEYMVYTSVAIIRLLRGFGLESKIKYPNDILVENRKICGILSESNGSLDIEYLVIGVGINVNQKDFGILNDKATSINCELKETRDISELMNAFIHIYNNIEELEFNKVFDEYLNNSIVIGRSITLRDKIYQIKGIHMNGNLIVENAGKIEYLNLNEISLEELY